MYEFIKINPYTNHTIGWRRGGDDVEYSSENLDPELREEHVFQLLHGILWASDCMTYGSWMWKYFIVIATLQEVKKTNEKIMQQIGESIQNPVLATGRHANIS